MVSSLHNVVTLRAVWRLLHCLSLLSVCFGQMIPLCMVTPLCSWCTHQQLLPGCQCETEASEMGDVSSNGHTLGSRLGQNFYWQKENSSWAELPLFWDCHMYQVLQDTLFITENPQVSLLVSQTRCPEYGGNKVVWKGSRIYFPISRFNILPWPIDISSTLLQKTGAFAFGVGKSLA